MSRKLLLLWCIVLSVVIAGTSLAQDRSALWNAAKRVKFGIDGTTARPIQAGGGVATMNPLSPPNTADIQVFNPCLYWQSENSIGVNFSTPNQLMISTNGRIPGSNPVVHQTWAFSTDAGVTWPSGLQSEDNPPNIIDDFGDPVAFFDRSGRAYYCTLGSPGGVYFVSTTNFGATWSARSNADNLSSANDDKQHATADFSGTYPNNVYTAWTDFGVGSGMLQFARSTNQGTSWLPRVQLAIGSNRGQGNHIAIGPNGEVYVIWAHYTSGTAEVGIGVAKSTDGGANFNTPTVAFPINGIRISNAGITQLNNARASSFPYADVDRSSGPRRGWVYVVTPELDVPNTGQSDITLHRSTDGGTTWSAGIKINGPDVQTGKWQFMPSIAVDPTTGGISVSYYSLDSTGTNFMTNRYMAYSVDGGTTWDNFVISDVRALWAPQGTPNTNTNYNGDYYETAAMNGKAWACWTDRRSGATGSSNKAYVGIVTYAENFGFIRGIVTTLGSGTPVSGANIDFVQSVLQQGATTDPTGFYFAGAKVDTPGTTANLTLRSRKFGYVDTTLAVTLTRHDTLNRNFQMRTAPGGTLSVFSHTATTNLRSFVEVKFGSLVVVSDSTNATTGLLTAPLPTGTYSVKVDAPNPYLTKTFPSVVINAGTTTNVDALTRSVLEYSPTAMRDTLPVGGSRVKVLTLTNASATDSLPFRITDDNARIRTRIIVPSPAVQYDGPQKKGQPDTQHGKDSPRGHGGPDAFGYSWIDSDDPGGPIPNYVDISTVGTQITAVTSGTLDDGYATIALPWAFTLYGNSYTSINIGTNGFVNFGTGSTSLSNDNIPTATAPNNAIYAFWDDLDFRTLGKLLYYNDVANGNFIVAYHQVPRYNGTSETDTLSFEIIMKPSGEVVLQYQRMGSPTLNSATVGIENAAGTVATNIAFNSTYVHDNLAVRIYLPDAAWLSESPTVGTIPPSANAAIQCTFNAAGLSAGSTLNGVIKVDVTHPDVATTYNIPASLRVSTADSQLIILNKTALTFPATQINTTRRDTTLIVRNGGALTLSVTSITTTNPRFTTDRSNATIAPNDSVRVRVTYAPLVVGTDTGRIVILSNSSAGLGRKEVTLTGTSLGAPGISVSTTTLADTLQVGQSHAKTFTITNTSAPPTTPLYVALTDSATWLTESPTADTLAGSQTKTYTETFNATGLTVGTYTTNVRITSNDPANPLKTIATTLRVVGGPIISTRPDSTVKSLPVAGSGVDSFYIRNTGVSALNWQMSEIPGSAPDLSKMHLKYHAPMPELPKGVDHPVTDNPDSSGGPDAFGYRFIDSDSPGGPIFNWVDITSIGTQVTAWTTGTADDGYVTIPLPFSFTFYGVTYNNINICTNGYQSFTSLVLGSPSYTNQAIPAVGEPNAVVAPFWDDLNFTTSGTVHYYFDAANSRFIIQYTNAPPFSGTGTSTFQTILKANGEILYQYFSMTSTVSSSTVGIEDSTGTVGLQATFNAPYLHDNLAVRFSRGVSWLDEAPTSGTVNPGDSAKVRLTFNTTGLLAGVQRGILSIASNDFSHNPFNYVVRLTVSGGPPTVTVTAPNGGENWAVGSTHQITWDQNGVDTVTIGFSTTGRTGTYTTITSGVPARPSTWEHPKGLVRPIEGSLVDNPLGSYNWVIPNTVSANCWVRIVRKSSGSPGDTSNAAFTISAGSTGDTSWVAQPIGTTTPTFYSVKAVDQNVVWVGGTAGTMYKTTNGGTTWTSVGGGAIGTADVYTVEAISANVAFASTSPSGLTNIYRTTDGGTTWTLVYTLSATTAFIDGIQMLNATTGYAMGDPVGSTFVILKTTDGGATWVRSTTEPAGVAGTDGGWNNSFQVLGTTMWFGTNTTKIFRSTDLGATWTTPTPTGSVANSYGVHFNNATLGMAGFAAGATNASTNSGATWAAAANAGTGQVTGVGGVATVNPSEFWVTSGTNIDYTSNQGVAWTASPKNGYTGAISLWALNMYSPNAQNTYGWAVGASGTILRYHRLPTDVAENGPSGIPTVFALEQNYPNPFNPTTTIRFSLPEQATVSLKVYNLLGQEIATLADGDMTAAFHNVVWDGRNHSGTQVASGMYFYRFDATGVSGAKFTSLKKLVLLK